VCITKIFSFVGDCSLIVFFISISLDIDSFGDGDFLGCDSFSNNSFTGVSFGDNSFGGDSFGEVDFDFSALTLSASAFSFSLTVTNFLGGKGVSF